MHKDAANKGESPFYTDIPIKIIRSIFNALIVSAHTMSKGAETFYLRQCDELSLRTLD